MLVNPFESEQQGGSVKEAENLCVWPSVCLCLRACARVCVCVRMRAPVRVTVHASWKWWSGQRKQDANEPALINVCLISYSALSGHGKDRGGSGERECWEEFMRKCRPNL